MARKPGRPRGSKTRPRLGVVAAPPLCPACGRSLSHLGRTAHVRLVPTGQAPSGQPANHVRVRYLTCECGQPLAVRQYLRDPA